jgi:hypothetical protein
MKFRHKLYISSLLTIVVLFSYGWATSTRHIDMKFMEDGVPLSGCELHMVLGSDDGHPEIFHLKSNGGVRIPVSHVGKKAIYAIKRGEEIIHSVYEPKFERGETTVDFRLGGIESTHRYRFLVYDSTTVAKSSKLRKENSEQAGTGQPATRSQLKSEGSDKPQPEAEGRSR